MVSTTIRELINLDAETSKICGWLCGGKLELDVNVKDEGDVVYYCDIHSNALKDGGDLLAAFNGIHNKVCKLWGKDIKEIEIIEDKSDDNLTGYSIAITLSNQE